MSIKYWFVAMCQDTRTDKYFFRIFDVPDNYLNDPQWYYLNEIDLFNVVCHVFTLDEYRNLQNPFGAPVVLSNDGWRTQ